MERPENESPEQMIIDRTMTYSLRNGKSSRELSQNKLISEISTYPLKDSVIGIYTQCEQMICYPLDQ